MLRGNGGTVEAFSMIKRLAFGLALALLTAPVLSAAPTLPEQATSHLPWDKFAAAAADALCTYLGLGCS